MDGYAYEVKKAGFSRVMRYFLKPRSGFYKDVLNSRLIVHFADFKYISLWCLILVCFFSNRKIFLHGQGGYKRKGLLHKITYNIILTLSDGYICYSEFSAFHLKSVAANFLHRKIYVVDNSLYLQSKRIFGGDDVLYIGRLRTGCGIELLLEAALTVDLNVRVIGGGDHGFISELKKKYSNLIDYGTVFDEAQQFEIANDCFVGAYGGDAGLSVVHYMSYGLPVVVHSNLYKHMGPEPSYIKNGENGLTFERGNVHSLANALLTLKNDKDLQQKLGLGALETFKQLNNPPMHEKFAKILGLI